MVPGITAFRLRKYRRTLGFSQVGAARLLGVTATELMLWEKGLRMPKGINLFKLEALYHHLISDMYAEIRQEAIREIQSNKLRYGEYGTGMPP